MYTLRIQDCYRPDELPGSIRGLPILRFETVIDAGVSVVLVETDQPPEDHDQVIEMASGDLVSVFLRSTLIEGIEEIPEGFDDEEDEND